MLGQSLGDYGGPLSAGKQWDISTQRTRIEHWPEWRQNMKSLPLLTLCSDVTFLSVFRFPSSLLWCLRAPCFLLKKRPINASSSTQQTALGSGRLGDVITADWSCVPKPEHHDIRHPELTDKRWQGGLQSSPCGCLGNLLAPRSAS